MKNVKILRVLSFKPSTDPKIPAEFLAVAKIGEETIKINMMSLRKLLNVKRLSQNYLNVISENKFNGTVTLKKQPVNSVYVLDRNANSDFVAYLKEQASNLHNEAKRQAS